MKARGVLTLVLAIVLGAVFVYASLDKIAHPGDFARIIYHYRLVGPSASVGPLPANLVAVMLPWVEMVAGIALISGVWRREAAGLAALLLMIFLGSVSWALVHGIDIENCGCFTVTGAGRGAGIKLLLEDLGLLAAAIFVAVSPAPSASTFRL
ncbi:MAG: MauE/DoxX family redox-associated membrane protein [Vicinamibacteria bacterium]